MTSEEKTIKIADLALAAGRYRRELAAALAACDGCPTCAEAVEQAQEMAHYDAATDRAHAARRSVHHPAAGHDTGAGDG